MLEQIVLEVDLGAIDFWALAGIDRHAQPVALGHPDRRSCVLLEKQTPFWYSNPLHPPPTALSRNDRVERLFLSANKRLSSSAARSVSFTVIQLICLSLSR